jgi:hypothetical protein
MRDGAREAGELGVWQRYRDFASTYRQGIARFTRQGWQDLLQLRRGAGRAPQFGAPIEDDYQLSNLDALKKYWAAEPVGTASTRGTSPLNKFRLLARELATEPDGTEALVQFAAQEFYDATMQTGTFDVAAAQRWVLNHQNKLNTLPALETAFTGVRQQVARIHDVETQSAAMLDALSQERLQAVRLAQDARSREMAAKLALAQTRGVVDDFVGQTRETVTSMQAAAQQGVNEAVAKWKTVFGNGDAASAAQDLASATADLGTDALTLVQSLGQKAPAQRAFALNRLTEPVKDNLATVRGIVRARWEDFWQRRSAAMEGMAPNFATDQLSHDFWLADPDAAMAFLKENQSFFARYFPKDHYDHLVTLARGMQLNSRVLPGGSEGLAPALRGMTPGARWLARAGIGIPAWLAASATGLRFGMSALGLGGLADAWGALADHKRIALLNKALLESSVADLLTLGDKAKTLPTKVLSALWYTMLSRTGLTAQEVSDAADAQ